VDRYLQMPELLDECGELAATLLEECERVVIQWDERPLWGTRECWGADRQRILASLEEAEIVREAIANRITLLAIKAELETWFLADRQLIEAYVKGKKGAHQLKNRFRNYRKPETIANPKNTLIGYTTQELGRARRYNDTTHALPLAQNLDLRRAQRVPSFQRFLAKVARTAVHV